MPSLTPRLPPGPPPRRKDLLGSLAYYWRFSRDPIGFVGDRFAKYGDVYYAPSDGVGLYVIKHPDHLHDVLTANAAKYGKGHSALQRVSEIIGDGMLTTDGETWRRQRKLSQPAFAKSRLAGYTTVMAEEGVRALASWRPDQPRDVAKDMMTLTLRVVSKALFGHDLADADVLVVDRLMSVFQAGALSANVVPAWLPNPVMARLKRASADLDKLVYGLIADSQRSPRNEGEGADDPKAKATLLELLVNAVDEDDPKARLSPREVRDNLLTLLLAGHETTSNALTWTLYALSQNPAIEAALVDEIDRVLGGRPPTYDDLPKLVLTERVLKESMRMYPPVPSMARVATEDTELGGYPVAKGSEIILWVYLTHHDPRFYPDPSVFRPDRFLPENEAKLPKAAYIPFGAGPRACIGKAFAMIEAQLLLALLVQRFHFALVPGQDVRVSPRVTLRPKNGLRMVPRARRPKAALRGREAVR
jgi:cytochrome P450